MLLHLVLAAFAVVSLALTLWQWWAARRFPLHARLPAAASVPSVSVLKPLKGVTPESARCLESWLRQRYPGELEILFGVATLEDPIGPVVRRLLQANPHCEAQLVLCPESLGPSGKVSCLCQLLCRAKHSVIVLSDDDVWVPPDYLEHFVTPLQDDDVGLVCSLYRLANPATPAMRWEAVAINADFWPQVLMAQSLRPLDFALGAVMGLRRQTLAAVGGLEELVQYLADDFELGQRVVRHGKRIALATVVADCLERPMGWQEVWRHQVRWARTIRVCRPVPYFLSLVANATLWPLLLLGSTLWSWTRPPANPPTSWKAGLLMCFALVAVCIATRLLSARDLMHRIAPALEPPAAEQQTGAAEDLHATSATKAPCPDPPDGSRQRPLRPRYCSAAWFAPVKDVLNVGVWAAAFLSNRLEWRGAVYRVDRRGRLVAEAARPPSAKVRTQS
jgi:ceramide glucosyltransferase